MESSRSNQYVEKLKTAWQDVNFNELLLQNTGTGFVLEYLYKHEDETINAKDIAVNLRCSLSRVTNLLNTCIKKEWVNVSVDSNDRRKKIIKISEQGKQKRQEMVQKINNIIEQIILEVGEEDLNKFIEIGKRISLSIKNIK